MDTGVIKMVMDSGLMVKLVLILLVLSSLACWSIIVVKSLRFSGARKKNMDFARFFWDSDNIGQLYNQAKIMPESTMACVFMEGFEEIKRLQESSKNKGKIIPKETWIESLNRSLNKGIRIEISSLERTIPFLATIGNTAPFIGLFGTVWGIMKSFHGIAEQGTATLATVAPGIAEALIATAAGLSAAIPSVVAFYAFVDSLNRMETELNAFSGDFLNLVERKLLSGKEKEDSED